MAGKLVKRDSKGRFAPGHGGGPGRPSAPKEQEYLRLLRETIDLGEWRRAVQGILAKAQGGDVKAFTALAKFLLPLPAQLLKISTEPQEEFRVAGWSVAQLDEAMLKRLFCKVEEKRLYEQQLANDGVPGYEHAPKLKSVRQIAQEHLGSGNGKRTRGAR